MNIKFIKKYESLNTIYVRKRNLHLFRVTSNTEDWFKKLNVLYTLLRNLYLIKSLQNIYNNNNNINNNIQTYIIFNINLKIGLYTR